MANMTGVKSVLGLLRKLEISFLQWTGFYRQPGIPALVGLDLPFDEHSKHTPSSRSGDSLLESIFGNTLWAAVPKNRRSVERRMTRKMAKFEKNDAIPKKTIVACLECGHWHQKNTICGNCYEKVREETREMRRALGNDLFYNAPRSEMVFLYDGEETERPQYKGNYIVEMKKPRPQWFPKHLMTKS